MHELNHTNTYPRNTDVLCWFTFNTRYPCALSLRTSHPRPHTSHPHTHFPSFSTTSHLQRPILINWSKRRAVMARPWSLSSFTKFCQVIIQPSCALSYANIMSNRIASHRIASHRIVLLFVACRALPLAHHLTLLSESPNLPIINFLNTQYSFPLIMSIAVLVYDQVMLS